MLANNMAHYRTVFEEAYLKTRYAMLGKGKRKVTHPWQYLISTAGRLHIQRKEERQRDREQRDVSRALVDAPASSIAWQSLPSTWKS